MHHFREVNNKAVPWGQLAVFLGYTSLANAQTVQESAKVYSATHSDNDLFGFSVATYENRILVGALK